MQTEVCFMTYEELFSCLPLLRQAVIKLEPCVSDETDFLKYALLNQAYKETLQRLSEMSLPDDVCFLNTPDALLRALDKKETKEVLILKWYKYNWSKSEKTLVGVENVAKHIKSDDFRRYVMNTVNKVRGSADDCQTEEEPKNIPSVSVKKVSYSDMLNDMVSEFAISDYLLESVQDWIAYKGERNFKYKERGLRTLLKTISEKSTQYGDTAVSTAINESISSGYQGIVWEKIGKASSSDINWNF